MAKPKTFRLSSIFLALLTAGCAGNLNHIESPPILIHGAIVYEGNRDYLPRTVAQGDLGPGDVKIRYQYEVEQGREDGTDFFIPLLNTMVQGRAGSWVVAAGLLEIIENGQTTHSFDAVQQRLADGVHGTLTKLRREALFAVRNEIERKMITSASSAKSKPTELKTSKE